MIPWNGSVKILCRGTLESYLYQLEILENLTYKQVEKQLGFQEVAEFVINPVDTNTAGRYQCRYRREHHWSAPSEALELVVTGAAVGRSLTRQSLSFLSFSEMFCLEQSQISREIKVVQQTVPVYLALSFPILNMVDQRIINRSFVTQTY